MQTAGVDLASLDAVVDTIADVTCATEDELRLLTMRSREREREMQEGVRRGTCGKRKQRRREGESDKGRGGVRMIRKLLLLMMMITIY